ncbi:ABC transporter ATP-binding protein [Candidatus Margulisiibacteriota bacterium]
MKKDLIKVNKLVKKFNELTAVDGISFSVHEGECLGILGPNGAGKTTAVKVIQCISPLTSGEVTVLGMPASLEERRIRAMLGLVPQENELDPDLSVFDNLLLFSRYFDIPKKIAKERINELLEFVSLGDKKKKKIEELSGGMKRRLLIARGLINDPKLMILDEPTTGLDPQARHLVWQRLRSLKDKGVTMILNTQYMEEAQQLCDRLLIMHKGKILKKGSPAQLVKEEVGEEVIEVRNHGSEKDVLKMIEGMNFTHEIVGDTLYIYSDHSAEIMPKIVCEEHCSILRRPATLEDVFLKLTGRGLTE